jgi:hypothetical protein
MTDFLDEKRREIQDRLAELRPLIDEYQRLEAAVSALAQMSLESPLPQPVLLLPLAVSRGARAAVATSQVFRLAAVARQPHGEPRAKSRRGVVDGVRAAACALRRRSRLFRITPGLVFPSSPAVWASNKTTSTVYSPG